MNVLIDLHLSSLPLILVVAPPLEFGPVVGLPQSLLRMGVQDRPLEKSQMLI